jgi:hypothetical protein
VGGSFYELIGILSMVEALGVIVLVAARWATVAEVELQQRMEGDERMLVEEGLWRQLASQFP